VFVNGRGEVTKTEVWVGFDDVIFAEYCAVEMRGVDGSDAYVALRCVGGYMLISFA